MGPLDFVFGLLLLGTVTGVVKILAGALAARGVGATPGHAAPPSHQTFVVDPRLTPDQLRSLETQLSDARLQNDQLQKQLDWHNKLLETQDRLIDRIGTTPPRPATSSAS